MAPKYQRRVIHICAEDSPNVKRALAQIAAGIEPDNLIVTPGVLPYDLYKSRRKFWDAIRQCVGLDGRFYKGPQLLLWPPDWLLRAASPLILKRCFDAPAEAIGIDTGEGGDNSALAAVNRWGVKDVIAYKTPDTDVIPRDTLAFMTKHRVPADKVCFDSGGGGKVHADRLRAMGYPVRTVAFGESILLDLKRAKRQFSERVENREERYTYFNRRSEMYGEFSVLCDPFGPGFAIPREFKELRRQLGLIPKTYDGEGRLKLLPKNKRTPDSKEKTLRELLKCSPDESDAVVVAIHAMTHKSGSQAKAGIG